MKVLLVIGAIATTSLVTFSCSTLKTYHSKEEAIVACEKWASRGGSYEDEGEIRMNRWCRDDSQYRNEISGNELLFSPPRYKDGEEIFQYQD